MKIALVMPVLNAQDTIQRCLESVMNQERQADEIILVDNGSTDKTIALIESFRAQNKHCSIILLHEKKRGAGAARNKGIQAASAQVIAFTDSDCILPSAWLKNIEDLYNKHNVDAIGGLTYLYNPAKIFQKLEAMDLVIPFNLQGSRINDKNEILFGKLMGTFNCSCKTEALAKVKGFDESFSVSGEDIDLTFRLFEAGFSILVWHPALSLWHMPRRTYGLLLKKLFQYKLALPLLMKKHLGKLSFIEIPGLGFKAVKLTGRFILTKEFLMLIISTFLAALFYKTYIWILTVAFLALIFRIYTARSYSSRVLRLKLNILEKILIIPLDIIAKTVSEAGKVYSGLRSGYFYL